MNKEEIKRLYKGSKENPITNEIDLINCMIGRINTIIYVKGNFTLDIRTIFDIQTRNIELRYIDE